MPLTNADNPTAERPKKSEPKTEAKAQPKAEPTVLLKAAAASSPDVQHLLARRMIAASNDNAAKLAEIDAALAELGYAV